ncbi:hypothetical protein [Riemerella anatipestifer]|uniref:hypothetical protein n=1 Tax=Riemerella anatipestifer TaxID=34085 RepID=UPI0013737A8C|nr:hypothetical protein [Riemerella anatipestifer]MBT0550251.1 hypothetical protein [Riemerella anatipestifer]MBT0556975.1 hypothetical protein [Riemerella anatipestifer]MBT0561011.1 hypothetical protein [Riemerella anatipestifer]NAV17318.1 hypothetical protein [Riemerella anatipestifer]
MATAEQIRQGLIEMAGSYAPVVSNIASVKSVDEEKATCILIDEDEQEFLNVRLRPVLNGNKSFIQIPKVGSFVLAIRIEDDDDWMVISCDEVEKVIYYVGDSVFQIDDKFHFSANGADFSKVFKKLLKVIEKGYKTNTGVTIQLIDFEGFKSVESDIKKLLK